MEQLTTLPDYLRRGSPAIAFTSPSTLCRRASRNENSKNKNAEDRKIIPSWHSSDRTQFPSQIALPHTTQLGIIDHSE